MNEELEPPKIFPESRAMELLRVWLVDGKPTVVITPNLWDDPSAWGLLLADLVKHLGNAYSEIGQDRNLTMNRIKEALDVEWLSPTSDADPIDE